MRAHNRGEDAILAPVNRKPGLQVRRLPGSRVSLFSIVAACALSCKARLDWTVSCTALLFQFQRGRMLGLVEPHFAAPGNLDLRDKAPALIFDLTREFDFLGFQVFIVAWMSSHIR